MQHALCNINKSESGHYSCTAHKAAYVCSCYFSWPEIQIKTCHIGTLLLWILLCTRLACISQLLTLLGLARVLCTTPCCAVTVTTYGAGPHSSGNHNLPHLEEYESIVVSSRAVCKPKYDTVCSAGTIGHIHTYIRTYMYTYHIQ